MVAFKKEPRSAATDKSIFIEIATKLLDFLIENTKKDILCVSSVSVFVFECLPNGLLQKGGLSNYRSEAVCTSICLPSPMPDLFCNAG